MPIQLRGVNHGQGNVTVLPTLCAVRRTSNYHVMIFHTGILLFNERGIRLSGELGGVMRNTSSEVIGIVAAWLEIELGNH
jgi:hypothetical protein